MARRSPEIDVSSYEALRGEALAAFRSDPSHAVAMARQAVTIQEKRKVGSAKSELRRAETVARELCAVDPDPFVCKIEDPCGTGSCPYSTWELSQVDLPPGRYSQNRSTQRPRRSMFPFYDLDLALRPLIDYRNQQGKDGPTAVD